MELIKLGEKIMPKPKGLDYKLTTDKTYDLLYDRFSETVYLKENGSLNMPTKLYESEEDQKFQNTVINAFKTTTKCTTAALLSGAKGTGKSVTAKVIAIKCELFFCIKELFLYWMKVLLFALVMEMWYQNIINNR